MASIGASLDSNPSPRTGSNPFAYSVFRTGSVDIADDDFEMVDMD